MFIPLAKIDEERRIIVGRAAQAVPDQAGEIMDYEGGKAAFQDWSQTIFHASGGLSKGNVRSMHNPRSVAGKVVELEYLDAEQAIDVMVKVVDDQDWKKCLEGVYTGFSIGGGYKPNSKRMDGRYTRYVPQITELSLVDNPCIKTATFAELLKRDGTRVEVPLVGRPRTYAELAAAKPALTYAALRAAQARGLPRARS